MSILPLVSQWLERDAYDYKDSSIVFLFMSQKLPFVKASLECPYKRFKDDGSRAEAASGSRNIELDVLLYVLCKTMLHITVGVFH